MRSSKSTAFTPSTSSSKSRSQIVAASARLRGLSYTLAVMADLRDEPLEQELHERSELEHHFRHALRAA